MQNPLGNNYKKHYSNYEDRNYNMTGMQTTFFDPPMPMRGSNPYT